MFRKIIVCVLLLAISGAQAFPDTNAESHNKQLLCSEKRRWYGDVMNNTKNMYDAYNTKLTEAKLPSDMLDKLNIENKKLEDAVAEMLKIHDTDSVKWDSIGNSTERSSLCEQNIHKYRELNVNLTRLAANFKTNVLNALDQSTVPKEVRDNLGNIVNFLYVTDMTENQYNDVKSLITKASTQTEKGIALETKYQFDEDGKLVDIDEGYKDILADNEEDKKLQNELKDLEDNTEIKAAEERALERELHRANDAGEGNDDSGFMSLGLGFGIATLAVILLSILVGSVLVWVRSQSYSRFS